MKKYFSFVILFVLLFITGCGVSTVSEDLIIDGIKFKTEYENYNNDHFYLEIDKENPFKYLDYSLASDVLASTNVIFVGDPTSNVSRAVVSFILSMSDVYDIGSIYYFDLMNNRPDYKVIDGSVENTASSDFYNYMLLYFDTYLDNNIIIDGKSYTLNTKVFSAPAIIFIKDGQIISYYDDFGVSDYEDFNSFGDIDINKMKDDLYNLIEKYED